MQKYLKFYTTLLTLFHTHTMILHHKTPGNLIDFSPYHSNNGKAFLWGRNFQSRSQLGKLNNTFAGLTSNLHFTTET